MARGWRRRSGAVENLALWQALVEAASRHDVQFTWVRGHAGHPKNEYADALAQAAALRQESPEGPVPSGFPAWLESRRAAGQYGDYDPDDAFAALERRLAANERLGLDAGA